MILDLAIKSNLQPLSVFSQQRVSEFILARIWEMKPKTKDEAKEAFARRLRDRLDELVPKKHKQLRWLEKEMNYQVSYETIRGWRLGYDFPEGANLDILATAVDMNARLLRYGESKPDSSNNPMLEELINTWHLVDQESREQLLEHARLAKRACQLTGKKLPDPTPTDKRLKMLNRKWSTLPSDARKGIMFILSGATLKTRNSEDYSSEQAEERSN